MFYDFVSLSDPKQGDVSSQRKKNGKVMEMIAKSKLFKNFGRPPIVLPSGDGAAICYKDSYNLPLDLSIELHKKIRRYNQNKNKKDQLQIRIGKNSGTIFIDKGIRTPNYWGIGIIHAKRIMDFGTTNHILLDYTTATELMNLSENYRKCIHHLGEIEIKHGDKIPIYSAYDSNFGNKTNPESIKHQIKPELVEKMGLWILEAINKKDMKPEKFIKILEQKEKSKLEPSLIIRRKAQTKKVKRKGELRK